MAVSSLMTAWCSYQSSQWGGQSSSLSAIADKREREAWAMHLELRQEESAHLRLLMEVIDDKLEGKERLAEFYLARFPQTLRIAWDKWMALDPFGADSTAPAHPLLPQFYVHPLEEPVKVARSEAAQTSEQASLAGNHSSGYLSNTVLLAIVLFFAGTAGKFDQRRVRLFALGFAVILALYAGVRMASLPVA